jgi:hypothetical protein
MGGFHVGQTVYDYGTKAAPVVTEVEMLTEEVLELLHAKKK